jgi:imidazolonepropionase-like amidohydrolase
MAPTTFTISDVRIFTGKEIIETGYVTVKDGIILDVSPGSPPSENTNLVLSRPGHTVIPGLIDAHMHAQGNDLALTQSLQFGVTTVQDMHNETANVHKM